MKIFLNDVEHSEVSHSKNKRLKAYLTTAKIPWRNKSVYTNGMRQKMNASLTKTTDIYVYDRHISVLPGELYTTCGGEIVITHEYLVHETKDHSQLAISTCRAGGPVYLTTVHKFAKKVIPFSQKVHPNDLKQKLDLQTMIISTDLLKENNFFAEAVVMEALISKAKTLVGWLDNLLNKPK